MFVQSVAASGTLFWRKQKDKKTGFTSVNAKSMVYDHGHHFTSWLSLLRPLLGWQCGGRTLVRKGVGRMPHSGWNTGERLSKRRSALVPPWIPRSWRVQFLRWRKNFGLESTKRRRNSTRKRNMAVVFGLVNLVNFWKDFFSLYDFFILQEHVYGAKLKAIVKVKYFRSWCLQKGPYLQQPQALADRSCYQRCWKSKETEGLHVESQETWLDLFNAKWNQSWNHIYILWSYMLH